ncbi:hypothetical protein DACRYDRAFT_23393 [Dacryopinax primogenitus]|uniref:Uncharacterized protein n=1 Tax=Dacryopinax primogenitus (strain DJM 731) TaxID=1858805 RepID=M5G1R0_DACPD|nr:uncharacterized protein DACRYDRAFT_23393 [Dacryopinax primogenitus]EJT99816.1 hypothetical protein DACRYDRAFT_23393 [Dacryopinax primogenitus]
MIAESNASSNRCLAKDLRIWRKITIKATRPTNPPRTTPTTAPALTEPAELVAPWTLDDVANVHHGCIREYIRTA